MRRPLALEPSQTAISQKDWSCLKIPGACRTSPPPSSLQGRLICLRIPHPDPIVPGLRRAEVLHLPQQKGGCLVVRHGWMLRDPPSLVCSQRWPALHGLSPPLPDVMSPSNRCVQRGGASASLTRARRKLTDASPQKAEDDDDSSPVERLAYCRNHAASQEAAAKRRKKGAASGERLIPVVRGL